MFVVWLNVGMAGVIGFFLYLYLFVTRLKLSNPWRWLAGIGAGLIAGILMMLVDFLIIMPPASMFVAVIGFAFMAAVLLVTLYATKRQQSLEKQL